jgi:hypothetical protein
MNELINQLVTHNLLFTIFRIHSFIHFDFFGHWAVWAVPLS